MIKQVRFSFAKYLFKEVSSSSLFKIFKTIQLRRVKRNTKTYFECEHNLYIPGSDIQDTILLTVDLHLRCADRTPERATKRIITSTIFFLTEVWSSLCEHTLKYAIELLYFILKMNLNHTHAYFTKFILYRCS